jgi:hypothetical protein
MSNSHKLRLVMEVVVCVPQEIFAGGDVRVEEHDQGADPGRGSPGVPADDVAVIAAERTGRRELAERVQCA